MKTMKKAFSLLLCCVLLATFAPAVHAKEDVLIAEASASYTIPAAGEAFNFEAVTVPDGAHYTAEIAHVYRSSPQEGDELENGFIVETGNTYFVCIRFTAESGYRIDLAETCFYINDQPADVDADLQMPVVSFTVSGGRDLDFPLIDGVFNPLSFILPFLERHPALKVLFYVVAVVALPFELIEEAGMWIAALFASAWERIFHPTTAGAV